MTSSANAVSPYVEALWLSSLDSDALETEMKRRWAADPLESDEELGLTPLNRRIVAYHEVGHAIAGCALWTAPLWIRFGSGDRDEDGRKSPGEAFFPMPGLFSIVKPENNTEDSAFHFLVIKMAGCIAQMKFMDLVGESIDHRRIASQARTDYHSIDLLFQHRELLSNSKILDDRDVIMAKVNSFTHRLLDENWYRVETLANELLESSRLTRKQIETVYDSAGVH